MILVDDGIATGASMPGGRPWPTGWAGLTQPPNQTIIIVVPVGSQSACRELAREADDVMCRTVPTASNAVGQFYSDVTQHRRRIIGPLKKTGSPGTAA